MLSGLKSFLRDYPMARAYLIYGGDRYLRQGEIEIFPFDQALKSLPDFLK
jgi:hypothetical protein